PLPLHILVFLLNPAGAAAAPARHWESAAPAKPEACVETVTDDPAVDRALGALTFDVGGQTRPLAEVRFEGASTFKDADLWILAGGRPEKLDPLRATTIVRRLASAGLFSRVAPVVEAKSEGIVLTLRLTEHPRVTKVVFEGL